MQRETARGANHGGLCSVSFCNWILAVFYEIMAPSLLRKLNDANLTVQPAQHPT
jgi:hypothetical protein